jgi:AAA+ ATPase superfamily predicted ATPase
LLFDERPKETRSDLFDKERELEELKAAIDAGRPLVVLSGIRRIGKTSLLKVALGEIGLPSILIDARGLKSNYGRRELYSKIATSLSSSLDRIKDLISIRGVKILGIDVELSWRGRDYLDLSDLFDSLNRRRVIIAIDEAQNLRGPLSSEMRNAIAHSYDYNRNLTFVLTGSEVGLLQGFLGSDEPSSPLYGRFCYTITIDRFTEEQSRSFLVEGFRQADEEVDTSVIEEAVRWLDGIPGWLTFFGSSYISGSRDLGEIKEKAVRLALSELKALFKDRPRRYRLVLKAMASGARSWSSVKDYIERKEGSTISSSVLHNILRNLEAMSVIEGYSFLDPVYGEASKRL